MSDFDSTPLGSLGALLRRPDRLPPAGRALGAAGICFLVYGGLSGFFQGGGQIFWAALKSPLIAAAALLLCLPSFLVFQLVAGVERPTGELLRAAAGFVAVLGLLLVALGPVAWLFAVTSRSLGFMTFFHLVVWGGALLFGLRYLRAATGSSPLAVLLWLLVFWLVSLQLTAYLGPVLVRRGGEPLFELRRESFLARFGRICDQTLPLEAVPLNPDLPPAGEVPPDPEGSRKEPR